MASKGVSHGTYERCNREGHAVTDCGRDDLDVLAGEPVASRFGFV